MSKEAYPLGATALDELIRASLKYKDRAYAPYSKFRVGAALLSADGQIFGGCNVENASYGAGICAERTAIVKAISEGQNEYLAVVVSSDVPAPTTSPCGICRQFLREFLSPNIPIYFVSSEYPLNSGIPNWLNNIQSQEASKFIKRMTMEELLPNSFGPDNLGISGPK
ncbi:cytidine deaminase [Kwoniella pini CBS 10737]|uniref:Cytidine deaminase n=1 Tax=Kwoniella pini CBS 10737 TaxID=1296096 RepID=A0A1B9IDU7_9TREE|nr:cytidine deaminase [Kwoniella pini CBS 10737]OCF53765.1 cytidine deaminase [Kwoniella pini CBS 10737]